MAVVVKELDADIAITVDQLASILRARGAMLAAAESCTGGLIAAACTSLPGSSDWFERGVVTYSNEAKIELLGVDAQTIAAHGAVSEAVARAMAEGLLQRSHAGVAVAVTGVAGPGGGTPAKPVGTVWVAVATRDATTLQQLRLLGDRSAIRRATVIAALEGVTCILSSSP